MKRMYLLLIAIMLVALLSLASCVPGWGQPGQGGMMGSQGGQGEMMGGQDGMTGPGMEEQTQPGTPGTPGSYQQPYLYGPGGTMGPGMMGPEMMSGMPMMGGMMGYYPGVPTPLSHDNVKAIAEQYLTSMNNPDLEIDEFEEYSHNFYVSLIEKSAGRGAIEIIIDRYSGSLQPEPQSMIWNSKYGMMGGSMMGGSMMGGSQQAQITVTQQQAMKIAQDFLDIVFPGTEVGEIASYYGYYTIMTTLEDEHYGMLSVNGYSGEVWYHTWHGMFISEVEEFHDEGESGH